MSNYDRLFDRYVSELREALKVSEDWWHKLRDDASRDALSPSVTLAQIEARWPFGPPSHPWVLGVYRKYFMLVVELNNKVDDQMEPEPEGATEKDWGTFDEAELEGGAGENRFEDSTPIAPWVLLVDALHGAHEDLVEAISWMVYQPVGLDEQDRPV